MQEKEILSISQEEYLAIRKESRIRAILVGILFVVGIGLYAMMLLNKSPYRAYFYTFGAALVGLNYTSWLPMWQKKKAIEKVHPEWTKLTSRGVKIPEGEVLKRFMAFGGAFVVTLGVFAVNYHPVKQDPTPKIPKISEIPNLPSQNPANLPDSSMIEEVKRKSLEDIRQSQNENKD